MSWAWDAQKRAWKNWQTGEVRLDLEGLSPAYEGISPEYIVKDSGARTQFASGMVRDTAEGKVDYLLVRDGPMFKRWAEHLTKGAVKYSKRNWLLAAGEPELARFQESAARHFEQWLAGDMDEDHAAAVFFGINGACYVQDQLIKKAGI